jgi:hypothetical protein
MHLSSDLWRHSTTVITFCATVFLRSVGNGWLDVYNAVVNHLWLKQKLLGCFG